MAVAATTEAATRPADSTWSWAGGIRTYVEQPVAGDPFLLSGGRAYFQSQSQCVCVRVVPLLYLATNSVRQVEVPLPYPLPLPFAQEVLGSNVVIQFVVLR